MDSTAAPETIALKGGRVMDPETGGAPAHCHSLDATVCSFCVLSEIDTTTRLAAFLHVGHQ